MPLGGVIAGRACVCLCVCVWLPLPRVFLLKGRRETDSVGAEVLYSSSTPSLQKQLQ